MALALPPPTRPKLLFPNQPHINNITPDLTRHTTNKKKDEPSEVDGNAKIAPN